MRTSRIMRMAGFCAFVAGLTSLALAASGSAEDARVDLGGGAQLRDGRYSNACGPIACFIAVKALGGSTTIDEMAARCAWSNGKMTTLRTMDEVVTEFGFHSQAVRLSPAQLHDVLANGGRVAILPVRNGETVDHAICAIRAPAEDLFEVIDYPKLNRFLSVVELESIWDGAALVVSHRRAIDDWLLFGGLCGFFGALLAYDREFWRARRLHRAVLMAALGAGTASPAVAGEPRDDPRDSEGIWLSHDFGDSSPDAAVRASFTVRNESSSRLNLRAAKITASCGCISLQKCPDSIEPGRAAKVVVQLETARQRGRVEQYVALLPEHHTIKYVRLTVSGVVKSVWADPGAIDLGAIGRSPAEHRGNEFYILAASLPDVIVKRIWADNAALVIKEHEASTSAPDADKAIRALRHVSVEWSGGTLKPGRFRATVFIETNDERFAKIQVPVTAHVVGNVDLRPSRLVFGRATRESEVRRTCTVDFGQREPAIDISHLELRTDHDCVRAAIKKTGKRALIEAVLDARALVGETNSILDGEIVAQHHDKILFSIPYVAYVESE